MFKQPRAVVKVEAVAEEKVNWSAYFDHIRSVCPWSYSAFKKGEIKITNWNGEPEPLGNNQAIVYVVSDTNRRRLKKLAKKLDNDKSYEWLWSEPKYGKFGSPVPILIQQDRRKLFDLRYDQGYYNDIEI